MRRPVLRLNDAIDQVSATREGLNLIKMASKALDEDDAYAMAYICNYISDELLSAINALEEVAETMRTQSQSVEPMAQAA